MFQFEDPRPSVRAFSLFSYLTRDSEVSPCVGGMGLFSSPFPWLPRLWGDFGLLVQIFECLGGYSVRTIRCGHRFRKQISSPMHGTHHYLDLSFELSLVPSDRYISLFVVVLAVLSLPYHPQVLFLIISNSAWTISRFLPALILTPPRGGKRVRELRRAPKTGKTGKTKTKGKTEKTKPGTASKPEKRRKLDRWSLPKKSLTKQRRRRRTTIIRESFLLREEQGELFISLTRKERREG